MCTRDRLGMQFLAQPSPCCKSASTSYARHSLRPTAAAMPALPPAHTQRPKPHMHPPARGSVQWTGWWPRSRTAGATGPRAAAPRGRAPWPQCARAPAGCGGGGGQGQVGWLRGGLGDVGWLGGGLVEWAACWAALRPWPSGLQAARVGLGFSSRLKGSLKSNHRPACTAAQQQTAGWPRRVTTSPAGSTSNPQLANE